MKPGGRIRLTARLAARLAAGGLLATSTTMLLLPASPADASGGTVSPAVTQASWFWQTAYEQANPPVAPPAAPPSEPSGVPSGDLAVGYTGATDASGAKTPAKMTALAFDTSLLTPGSTVSSFTFTLTLDSSPSATTFAAQGATLLACLPTRGWSATLPDGGDYTNEPTYDCTNGVAPVVSGNDYTFKIPAIAQTWASDQNLGVVVVPDPKNTAAPFQLVFSGPKSVKASMTYVAGTPVVAPSPAPTSAGSGGTGGTGSSGGSTGGGTGGGAPTGGVPIGNGPVAVPTDGGAAPPVVAPTSTPVAGISTVADVKPASSAPPAGFWAALAGLAALMLLISFVLGDPNPPVAAGGRSKLTGSRSLR